MLTIKHSVVLLTTNNHRTLDSSRPSNYSYISTYLLLLFVFIHVGTSTTRSAQQSIFAQFVAQNEDQGAWPTRLWLRSTGGDPAQPLLLTARQRSGALTWQLPYHSASGRRTFHELSRTLCYDAYSVDTVNSADCGRYPSQLLLIL